MSFNDWNRARDAAHQQRLPQFAVRINQVFEERAIKMAGLAPDALTQVIPDADSARDKAQAFNDYLVSLLGRLGLVRAAFACFLADARFTGNTTVLALFARRDGANWILPPDSVIDRVKFPT